MTCPVCKHIRVQDSQASQGGQHCQSQQLQLYALPKVTASFAVATWQCLNTGHAAAMPSCVQLLPSAWLSLGISKKDIQQVQSSKGAMPPHVTVEACG